MHLNNVLFRAINILNSLFSLSLTWWKEVVYLIYFIFLINTSNIWTYFITLFFKKGHIQERAAVLMSCLELHFIIAVAA